MKERGPSDNRPGPGKPGELENRPSEIALLGLGLFGPT